MRHTARKSYVGAPPHLGADIADPRVAAPPLRRAPCSRARGCVVAAPTAPSTDSAIVASGLAALHFYLDARNRRSRTRQDGRTFARPNVTVALSYSSDYFSSGINTEDRTIAI
jgi:hypothetical protein